MDPLTHIVIILTCIAFILTHPRMWPILTHIGSLLTYFTSVLTHTRSLLTPTRFLLTHPKLYFLLTHPPVLLKHAWSLIPRTGSRLTRTRLLPLGIEHLVSRKMHVFFNGPNASIIQINFLFALKMLSHQPVPIM